MTNQQINKATPAEVAKELDTRVWMYEQPGFDSAYDIAKRAELIAIRDEIVAGTKSISHARYALTHN